MFEIAGLGLATRVLPYASVSVLAQALRWLPEHHVIETDSLIPVTRRSSPGYRRASSLSAPVDPLVPPKSPTKPDYLAELAVVIEKEGHYIGCLEPSLSGKSPVSSTLLVLVVCRPVLPWTTRWAMPGDK